MGRTWSLRSCYTIPMHIYFSGIGGLGIGPLALIAHQAGYQVSGSDARPSTLLPFLEERGIKDLHVGVDDEHIKKVHAQHPIDWFVYSPAQPVDFPNHPEFQFCKDHNIKMTKSGELVNEILSQKNLKLIAISGTHGKTTTTAMAVWTFQQLGLPVSYSLGARISFGDISHYEPGSQYFIYEADEFDRKFLALHPFFSLIAGVAYDHHEIYPSQADYHQAFRQFLDQSQQAVLWHEDAQRLGLDESQAKFAIESSAGPGINELKLAGLYNRRDAWLVVKAASQILELRAAEVVPLLNRFPGVARRFEKIAPNLYSDDAHTPDKIKGCMSVARELAATTGQKIIVLYEPLTNRRMHHLGPQHRDVFAGASKIYWLPSFLAREDPNLPVLTPAELITHLSPELQEIAEPAERDEVLKAKLNQHLAAGDMVVAMAGGGGDSLDEWLRSNYKSY